MNSDPTIGSSAETGDRLVGAGFKDSNGKYAVVTLTAGGEIPVSASLSPVATQDVNITEVGGNAVTTTVPVSGTVSVSGLQTDALTDTELRATPVPISGTITETNSTAIKTGVELIDDSVAVLGTATYTEAATKGIVIGAVRRDADTTLVNTTNEIAPLQVDANGYLKVEAFSGQTLPVSLASAQVASGAIASGAIASGAIASGAIASGALASGSIAAGAITAGNTSIATTEDTASAAGEHLVKVGAIRLDTPVANDNVSNSGDYTQFKLSNFGKLWIAGSCPEDTAHIDLEPILQNGQRRIDTAATSAGASGDWATENQSAEGASWATLTPTTTSGLSVANFNSGDTYTALTNTAQVIKASAGNLYGYYIFNPNVTACYVLIYNIAAASVTVGTSTAQMVLAIPGSGAVNLMFPYPITFSNAGWSIAAATTGGGNTAPGAALECMIWYK
jgi:hypothetical protein